MAKILVVDECRAILDLFSLLLEVQNHIVFTMSPNNGVIEQIEMFQPNLIFLDSGWNGVVGKDICRKIKSNPFIKQVCVVLLSTNSSILQDYIDCKADYAVEKPFNIEAIYNVIQKGIN